jgi:hypothetical protein
MNRVVKIFLKYHICTRFEATQSKYSTSQGGGQSRMQTGFFENRPDFIELSGIGINIT